MIFIIMLRFNLICSAVITIIRWFWTFRFLFHPISEGFVNSNWLVDFCLVFHFDCFVHLVPHIHEKVMRIIFVDRPSIAQL